MTPPKIEFPPALIAEARRLYEGTSTPERKIAALLGVSRDTFRSRLHEWGWKRQRRATRALDLLRAAGGPGTLPVTPPERRATFAALGPEMTEQFEAAIGRVIATIQPKDLGEAERATHILASIATMINQTAALHRPERATPDNEADDDAIPSDIDAFREALARRIGALIEEEPAEETGSIGDARTDQSAGGAPASH